MNFQWLLIYFLKVEKMCDIYFCFPHVKSRFLFIDPLGRPTITVHSDQYFHTCRTYVCPLIPSFQNLAKQNKLQMKIVIAAGETVGLSEGIIDNTFYSFWKMRNKDFYLLHASSFLCQWTWTRSEWLSDKYWHTISPSLHFLISSLVTNIFPVRDKWQIPLLKIFTNSNT